MENFRNYTRLRLRLETGDKLTKFACMAHIAHPLLGDQTYGGRPRPPKNANEAFTEALRNFKRQSPCGYVAFSSPDYGRNGWNGYTPLPDDFVELLHAQKGLPRTQRRIRLLR